MRNRDFAATFITISFSSSNPTQFGHQSKRKIYLQMYNAPSVNLHYVMTQKVTDLKRQHFQSHPTGATNDKTYSAQAISQ